MKDLRQEPEELMDGLLDDLETDREAYPEIFALMQGERDAQDPGAHFFESLQDEIMANLPDQGPEPVRVFQSESVKARPSGAGERGEGWLDRLRGLFGARPTLVYGLAMAAALLAIIFWPKDQGQTPQEHTPGTEVAHNDKGDQNPDKEGSALPVETTLSGEELAELRQIAAQMDLGDEDDTVGYDVWDSDDDWRTEPSGTLGGLSAEELKAIDEALQRSL